jgi:hypothetical protein
MQLLTKNCLATTIVSVVSYDISVVAGGSLYMWGGFTAELQCLRTFHKFSFETYTWVSVAASRNEVTPRYAQQLT